MAVFFQWPTLILAPLILLISAFQVAAAESNKRLALVIGNSGYQNVEKLTNPVNDATDIAKKLKSLQFDVILATNADHAKMRALLEEFKSRLTREHVALLFYAGHGVAVNNDSYLLPIDVPSQIGLDDQSDRRAAALKRELISMTDALAPLEAAKLGLLFLDACRTNASAPNTGLNLRVVSSSGAQQRAVSVMRGTLPTQITPSAHSAGVFRAYATQLDNTASDGTGRNSPFTKALLKHISTKGITIQELMIRVRKSVMEETNKTQIPWEEAALNESFYFDPPSPAAPQSASGSRPSTGSGSSAPSSSGGAQRPAANASRPQLPPNIGVGVGAGF